MSRRAKAEKTSRPSPRMRALFREIARNIIGRDRDARKAGRTQNTIGEIERALAKAYVWGQEALLDKDKALERLPGEPLDWMEIPPRAGDVLSFMTIAFSERRSVSLREGARVEAHEIEMFLENDRKRWTIVRDNRRSKRSVGDGSVAPLIRLKLLCPSPGKPGRYMLTESGVAAAREYWRRNDANDPTLPRDSLR